MVMKLTYEKIFTILYSKFELVVGKEKNYFLDEKQRIVATWDRKLSLITMFYDFPKHSKEIWNHYGKVAIGFAKDFNVNGQICDIFCIDGLCGALNDFIMKEDFSIDMMNNSEMRYLLDDNKNSLQKQFELLSYNKKVSILESLTGATFKGASIEDIQLFKESEKYALGNCGYLTARNGLASFEICGIVKVKNIVVNSKKDGYDVNIINFKNIQKKPNYKQVYDYYRSKNDWYYEAGYNTVGSDKTRAFIERRSYSTVDADAIHIPKDAYNFMLDPIYEKDNQSLNAKKLQMIHDLSLLLKNKKEATEYVTSHYNFNLRKCDLKRQRIKKS